MDIQLDILDHVKITVSDATAKVHSIEFKEVSIAVATILISTENLKDLSTAILDKLPLQQKIEVIEHLAEAIGGLWDDEEPLYKIEDIEYNKTLDKVVFKVEEVK